MAAVGRTWVLLEISRVHKLVVFIFFLQVVNNFINYAHFFPKVCVCRSCFVFVWMCCVLLFFNVVIISYFDSSMKSLNKRIIINYIFSNQRIAMIFNGINYGTWPWGQSFENLIIFDVVVEKDCCSGWQTYLVVLVEW